MSNSGSGTTRVYNIVLFAFQGADTAQDVISEAKAAGIMEGTHVLARAVVERDADGNVKIHEPGHGGIGGTLGAVAGGLAGLLVGPIGVIALAVMGGVLGGVAGHFAGREIPADDLKQAGESLPPNSSALVALIEDTDAEQLIGDMQGYNANVVTLTVGDELSGVISETVAADLESTAPAGAGTAASATGAAAKPAAGNASTVPSAGAGTTASTTDAAPDKPAADTTQS